MTDLSPGEVVVTIKYGKGFDDPWVVFHAPDVDGVKTKVIDYFGMDPGDIAMSGHSITVNARKMAQDVSVITTSFPGATVVSEESSTPAVEAPQTPSEHPLLARIAAVSTIGELQSVWAENKAAFDTTPALMDAYKAKGKSLS